MGTAQLSFAGIGPLRMTGSDVTGSDVSHVRGNGPARKYVLPMRNRKLSHIRPSGVFWQEVTKSRDRKRSCPEVTLTGSMFCACPAFSRVFFLVVVTWLPDVTQGHLTPLGLPWVCACATGRCTTPVMIEGHVTPSEVSMGCSLRRPHPIILGNRASYI